MWLVVNGTKFANAQLMVNGSWLMVDGQWFMVTVVNGYWLMIRMVRG